MKKIDILIIGLLILSPVAIGILAIGKLSKDSKGTTNIFSQFQKKIAVLKLEGVIMSEDDLLSQLEQIRQDKSIAGVVLRVNSPGGAVAPSQEIYQAVLNYRRDTKNPVYVSMGTVAASGGYYISAASDKIFANSGTLTGSIGVIMQFSHYQELMKKFGVGVSTITAGKLKDAGSPYKTLSPEDSIYFKDLLKDTHEQFILDVATARKMNADSLRIYAEGQVFTGNMAKKIRLVDEIGTYDDCCNAVLKKQNLPATTEFVDFSEKEKGPLETLFETHTPIKQIVSRLFPRTGVYFMTEEFQ